MALRATTEADEARGRLRRPVARPVGGPVNKFPVANGALPQPLRGLLAFAGHGSPPFRRDTEIHGKVPCQLEINVAGHWSSKFPWDSVSAKRVSVSGGGDATHRRGGAVGGCVLARDSARGPPSAGAAPRSHPFP